MLTVDDGLKCSNITRIDWLFTVCDDKDWNFVPAVSDKISTETKFCILADPGEDFSGLHASSLYSRHNPTWSSCEARYAGVSFRASHLMFSALPP